MKKIVIAIFILVLVFLGLTVLFFLNLKKDEPDKVEKKCLRETYGYLLEECGEEIIIGDHMLTLEKNYYNRCSGDAFCMFSVKRTDGKDIEYEAYCDERLGNVVVIEQIQGLYGEIIGIVNGCGSIEMDCEYREGVAYIYMMCKMLPTQMELEIMFGELYGEATDWKKVKLSNTENEAGFVVGNTTVVVSDISVCVDSATDVEELELVSNTDEVIAVIKEGELLDDYKKISNGKMIKYYSEGVLSTDIIKGIIVDGKRYDSKEISDIKYDEKQGYIVREDKSFKNDVRVEIDESKEKVYVRFVADLKENLKLDDNLLILLDWYDLRYESKNKCKIIYKAYETCEIDGETCESGKWIETEINHVGEGKNLYGNLMGPVDVEIDVDESVYDIRSAGMCIFVKPFDDFNILKNGKEYQYRYSNETLNLELELSYGWYEHIVSKFIVNNYHYSNSLANAQKLSDMFEVQLIED